MEKHKHEEMTDIRQGRLCQYEIHELKWSLYAGGNSLVHSFSMLVYNIEWCPVNISLVRGSQKEFHLWGKGQLGNYPVQDWDISFGNCGIASSLFYLFISCSISEGF